MEIVKICKKHGKLAGKDIYYYKTRIGNKYPRCYLCMQDRTKILRVEGYFRNYNKTQKAKKSKKQYYDKIKITDEFKQKRKKYYSYAKRWRSENIHTKEYKNKLSVYRKKFRLNNYDLCKQKEKLKAKNCSIKLTNGYIRKLIKLRSINSLLYCEEFIDLIRNLVLIKRTIRQLKEG